MKDGCNSQGKYGVDEPNPYESYKNHVADLKQWSEDWSKTMGHIDSMREAQQIINKLHSDISDILSTPAGARLFKWAGLIQNKWWYKIFSRIDPVKIKEE